MLNILNIPQYFNKNQFIDSQQSLWEKKKKKKLGSILFLNSENRGKNEEKTH